MNNYKRPVSLACRFELGLTNDLKKKTQQQKERTGIWDSVRVRRDLKRNKTNPV